MLRALTSTSLRTYRDEGISGLKIDKREGLKQLITDVCSGSANFSRVLVYDVSRWGRFQDVDESAHYEFLCRQAGIKVEYCAEQFDNDGSLLSSIVKNLKRVMAAEFSRELSAKVHAGQLRLAALGFGLRRELIDEDRLSKGYLRRGQQKNLKTDRVVLRLGPPEEVEMIQRIFREYVEDKKSEEQIVRRLNREGVPNHLGRPWTRRMVDYKDGQTALSVGVTMHTDHTESFNGKQVYIVRDATLHEISLVSDGACKEAYAMLIRKDQCHSLLADDVQSKRVLADGGYAGMMRALRKLDAMYPSYQSRPVVD
jgi:DNA invertase Pin-like site-specific DNA recombinase